MAKFQSELPNDVIKKIDNLGANYKEIFGEMCNESANAVYNNVVSNMGGSFKSTSRLLKCLKKTRVYQTPSDDGINVYVGFYGYFDDGTPAPLVAQAREYGTSRNEAKRPFLRKSFKKSQIEAIMKRIEDEKINGD